MYIYRNIVVHWHTHCCNTKATVCSHSTIGIHVAINIINTESTEMEHYIHWCQQYEKHLGLHIKCLIFLSNFNHIWIFWTDFPTISQKQILWKSIQWELYWCVWMDGWI